MSKQQNEFFYAKRFTAHIPLPRGSPPTLRIDKHLPLPSLCEASHNDGWGEGFEQREIKVPCGKLYVEPWTSEKSFFIATERELCQRLGLELPAEKIPRPAVEQKHSVLAQLREAKTAHPAVDQPHKKSDPER